MLAAAGAPLDQRAAAKAELIGALLAARRFEELGPLVAELRRETTDLIGAESDSLETAAILAGVAEALWQFGDLRSEALYRRALELRRKWLAEEHPLVSDSVMRLAVFLDFEERYEEALAIDRAHHAILLSRLGPDHQRTIELELTVAIALARLKRFEEALPLAIDGRERAARLSDKPTLGVATAWATQASIERELGDLAKAERSMAEAEKMVAALPSGEVNPGHLQIAYSRLRRAQKNYPAARAHFEMALAARRQQMGERDWRYTWFRSEFAELLIEMGRLEDAEKEAVASYDSLAANYGKQTAMVKKPLRALVGLYRRQGRDGDAQRLEPAIENVELRPARLGPPGG
jgi:hypothetical protein